MPTDQIRQARTVLEAIVSNDRATGFKLGSSKEITDLLKQSAVLQGNALQAGDDLVETDELRRAIGPFESQKDFGPVFVVMHADVERSLPGDLNLLRDMVAAVGDGEPVVHAASTRRSIVKLSGCSLV